MSVRMILLPVFVHVAFGNLEQYPLSAIGVG